MAFQDFISNKVSEKAALEAALVRVVAELQAANNAAPAVDDAVSKIKGLISVLQSSPASVVDAAKEAIRDACGDISLLPQNKEVSTLTVPRFVVETNSPVLADILGETETESDTNVTVDVVTTASANEILPSSFTSTDNNKDATEDNKPKRRTQAGFNRKVEEWTKKLNNLTTDNYESVIATVDDEFKYWTNGTKFESELISEKLQDSIAYWASLDQPESESKEIIEDDVPVTASSDVVETDTNETTVDLSSFNVEEETTEDFQIVEEITENTTISSTEELTSENPVLESVATTIDTTQKFLDRLNTDNLSEAGLSDLQEEIREFYGSGHIPQELLDATIVAWEHLNDNDDLDNDSVDPEVLESDDNFEEFVLVKEHQDDDIYDGDIPAEEELTEATDQPTENTEDIAQNKIVADNLSWQNSILTNCETWEELKEWDRFIANAVNKNPDSVLPETFTALDTTRSKLEARDAQQAKTVDVESLTQAWINRAELAFDLEEIQTIYNEIRESSIVPSMGLIKTLDEAKVRLTPVVPVVTTKPEISDEDIADAKACINNQWNDVQSEPTIEVQVSSTTTKKNPFAGRKSSGGKITVEVELTSSEQTQNTSDSITINSINTSGVFEFQSLDGKPEKHHRFDSRYILDPGTKLFEPSTKYVFEVATWDEVISLNPLIAENPNKLPLKSLHNPKRSYSKDAFPLDVFVIVSDEQADQFVQEYRATLVQMESNPNFEIGS